MTQPLTTDLADELRRAFDESFASRAEHSGRDFVDVLRIRIAGDAYAVRLQDIAGIVTRRVIVPVPAAGASLLGLAGIRGEVVPVFGLSTLLGYSSESDSPRWVVLCGQEELIGLGFSTFEGYVRVPAAGVRAGDKLANAREYIDEVALTGSETLPVIGIHRIIAHVRNRGRGQGET